MPTEAWVEALCSQAQRCSDEIARRSSTQQALEAATISASAALVGLVLTGNSSSLLLLIVPWIVSVFAHQWLDHHRTIGRIGGYMAGHLEPELQHKLGGAASSDFQFWETHIRRVGSRTPTRRSRSAWRNGSQWLWAGPIMLLYAGVSAIVLAVLIRAVWFDPYSAATHGLSSAGIEIWPRVVWVADVGLVIWLAVVLWRGLLLPPRTPPEDATTSVAA